MKNSKIKTLIFAFITLYKKERKIMKIHQLQMKYNKLHLNSHFTAESTINKKGKCFPDTEASDAKNLNHIILRIQHE